MNMENSKLKIVNTENAPAPVGPYNQCIVHNGVAYLSGQIAIDPATSELVMDDIETETHQVMKNIGALLTELGITYSDIIKCSIFISDMGQFARINEVYASYFTGYAPARECVQVAVLPKNVNIEISVLAAV
jgi:2-iminobutanoate/2-iminopropanoate deaminase